MKAQFVTDLPLGYDEHTVLALTQDNEVIAVHPVMPHIVYDETVMRWVPIETEVHRG